MSGEPTPPEGWKARPCPICGKPSAYATRPFCSERCRLIDLGHWINGTYAVPVVEDDDDENWETVSDGEKDD